VRGLDKAEQRKRAHEAVLALARSPLSAADVASTVELLWREESMDQVRKRKRPDRNMVNVVRYV